MIEGIERMLAMYESGAIDRRQFLNGLIAASVAPPALAQAPKPLFRGRVINHVTLSVADVNLKNLPNAKARSGRIITIDLVRREIEVVHKPVLTPSKTESTFAIRDDESLIEYIGRIILMIYEQERSRLGSQKAAAKRLVMHRNTLYSWLKWARQILKRKKK